MNDETRAAEFAATAESMRNQAKLVTDLKTRQAFEDIANEYELMARQQLVGLMVKDLRKA